jgi:hypothetical protein
MTTSTANARRMLQARAGRIILTISLILTPAAMVVFLFNGEHIANPAWHPHARFHVAQLAGIAVVVSLLGLWLLWRRTRELVPGAVAAAVIAATPPLAEFGALLVPGASPIPDEANPNLVAAGAMQIPGNLIAFTFMLVLIAIGLALALQSREPTTRLR